MDDAYFRALFLQALSAKEFRCKDILAMCQSAKCTDTAPNAEFWKHSWHHFLLNYDIMPTVEDRSSLTASNCQKWLTFLCYLLNNAFIQVSLNAQVTDEETLKAYEAEAQVTNEETLKTYEKWVRLGGQYKSQSAALTTYSVCFDLCDLLVHVCY